MVSVIFMFSAILWTVIGIVCIWTLNSPTWLICVLGCYNLALISLVLHKMYGDRDA